MYAVKNYLPERKPVMTTITTTTTARGRAVELDDLPSDPQELIQELIRLLTTFGSIIIVEPVSAPLLGADRVQVRASRREARLVVDDERRRAAVDAPCPARLTSDDAAVAHDLAEPSEDSARAAAEPRQTDLFFADGCDGHDGGGGGGHGGHGHCGYHHGHHGGSRRRGRVLHRSRYRLRWDTRPSSSVVPSAGNRRPMLRSPFALGDNPKALRIDRVVLR